MMLSFVIKDAPLAQSAEQDTLNVKVAGSIPAGRTLASENQQPEVAGTPCEE